MKPSIVKALMLALLVGGIFFMLAFRQQLNISLLEVWINQSGAIGPVVFMLAYILGTIFFFPGSALTLAGGALFGPVAGVIYNLSAATLGAIIAFLSARYLARDWVERKAGTRLQSLQQGVEAEGWKFVAFVRLVPLFPFNLLNYALGLTRIKLSHYSIASALCMLPGAIAYTYLGYAGKAALNGDAQIIQKSLTALALLAIATAVSGLIKKMRARQLAN